MSRHYWDEYIKFFIDNNKLRNVLKFHQSNINLLELDGDVNAELNKKEWINIRKNRMIFSDISLKKYNHSELEKDLQELFLIFDSFTKNADFITTFPVLVIYKERSDIESGCYTFNLVDKCLIKYCEIECSELLNIMIREGVSWSLSYFLSIEESIAAYGGIGYLKGIFQIGQISKDVEGGMENKLLHNIFINSQKFTHEIGINLRKQLLIHTSFIGV